MRLSAAEESHLHYACCVDDGKVRRAHRRRSHRDGEHSNHDEAASKHKALEAKVRFDSKTWPPEQVDGSSCGVLTVYNITLAAMGIAISPKLYVTHCGEQHLRNKLVHALRDIKNVDSRYWYANVKDPLHVYYDELELDTSIWCLSG